MRDDIRRESGAQQSTGPASARGKAIVSQNACLHGATARPEPTSVVAWMRVILDAPDLAARDMLGDDRRILSALALAEAEVRLYSAQAALEAFESGEAPAQEVTGRMDEANALLLSAIADQKATAQDMQREIRLLRQLTKKAAADVQPGGKRHKLLRRYLREAHGHRKRAFQAWLAMRAEGSSRSQTAAKRILPKQSRNAT